MGAYALADRNIAPHIPDIVRLGVVASPVEITAIPLGSLSRDPYLGQSAQEMRAAGIRDVIKLSYPTLPNAMAKSEAEKIVNQGYQSPAYREGQSFIGGTLHTEGGRPVADTGIFYPRFSRN